MERKTDGRIMHIMGQLIVQENGCCLWPGAKASRGHGMATYDGKSRLVHKLLYEHFVGPVPDGLVLDHFYCDTPACGNFAHVRPVTQRQNTLRGNNMAARNMAKRECKHGHPFDEVNTRYDENGRRSCRTCERERYLRRIADRVTVTCEWCGKSIERPRQWVIGGWSQRIRCCSRQCGQRLRFSNATKQTT